MITTYKVKISKQTNKLTTTCFYSEVLQSAVEHHMQVITLSAVLVPAETNGCCRMDS